MEIIPLDGEYYITHGKGKTRICQCISAPGLPRVPFEKVLAGTVAVLKTDDDWRELEAVRLRVQGDKTHTFANAVIKEIRKETKTHPERFVYAQNVEFADFIADICEWIRNQDEKDFDRRALEYIEETKQFLLRLRRTEKAGPKQLKLLEDAVRDGYFLSGTLSNPLTQQLTENKHAKAFKLEGTHRVIYVFTNSELNRKLQELRQPK